MQKLNLRPGAAPTVQLSFQGKPTMPTGRQPMTERRTGDPSSTPKVEKYPVPSFFEYRFKARDYDPL